MAKRQDVILLLDPATDLRFQLNPDGAVKAGWEDRPGVRVLGYPSPDLLTLPLDVSLTWDDEGAKDGG
jgi:hypothetical protein